MLRSECINRIIKKYGYENPQYLEIGVWNGETLREINTKPQYKDGVDTAQYGTNKYINYPVTSDEFFKDHVGDKMYDIIFVDGLHTAHQVTVDIINSLDHLKPGGFLILDDVYPHNEREQTALDLRRLGEPLTGDVWKGVYHILDDLVDMSSIVYFIKEVERGHLIFRISNKKIIQLDPSIPAENKDGFNPVEWQKYTYTRDFQSYYDKIIGFNRLI
jgi:hypothetical protein